MAKIKTKDVWIMGIWKENPVVIQVLGICSALAVTNRMDNALIMGAGLIFVTAFSEFTVSILRMHTPKHIRMMVQVLIISAFVIIVDIYLKAYLPNASKALGPYVGLIITNCIIMGRCEVFAQKNRPAISFLDGIFNGIGYTLVLMVVAFARELLGFGTFFGIPVMGQGWMNWVIMIMPPGAFFMLALVVWGVNTVREKQETSESAGEVKAR
ncbi:MAG: NADH:ubiquinone reductase (Na(+)-transporting) subunit D [Clostridiales bacterium]|nr:MAG: NADH:ubiquinone reductase (Na(+)-transporting) subunit D [Clostridiales bacterium]